jgi:hypothetical protein
VVCIDLHIIRIPYFLAAVQTIAATWLGVLLVAFFVLRAQSHTASHLAAFQSELRQDLKAIKEAL